MRSTIFFLILFLSFGISQNLIQYEFSTSLSKTVFDDQKSGGRIANIIGNNSYDIRGGIKFNYKKNVKLHLGISNFTKKFCDNSDSRIVVINGPEDYSEKTIYNFQYYSFYFQTLYEDRKLFSGMGVDVSFYNNLRIKYYKNNKLIFTNDLKNNEKINNQIDITFVSGFKLPISKRILLKPFFMYAIPLRSSLKTNMVNAVFPEDLHTIIFKASMLKIGIITEFSL